MPPSLLGPLAVIGAATLWGSNHVVARGIHEAVPLLAMVFWRWSLAIAILVPFSWGALTRDWPELKRHWRYLFTTGFVGVGIFSLLLFAGAYETQALQVGLLNATTPIWVLVLARLFRGEAVRASQVLGIALGIFGVVVLLTRGDLMRLGGVEWHRGDLWSILAAITFAWFSAPGKEFFAFAQEAWQESGRVTWPTRKETIQTTAIVFAFVVVMALFLFTVDTTLAWIVKLLTGRAE